MYILVTCFIIALLFAFYSLTEAASWKLWGRAYLIPTKLMEEGFEVFLYYRPGKQGFQWFGKGTFTGRVREDGILDYGPKRAITVLAPTEKMAMADLAAYADANNMKIKGEDKQENQKNT